MASVSRGAGGASRQVGFFATTHWSVVLEAGHSASPSAEAALDTLCRTYWYPLYAFVRRYGYSPADAQDLTQEFFFRLLAQGWLQQVDEHKGKFRSFLLGAMKHFLANEWRRGKSEKRGGRFSFQSLEDGSAEEAFQREPGEGGSPELLYEQRWATKLLETVLSRLRQEADAAGKTRQFQALEVFLTGDKHLATYAELADELSTTEAALKMATLRLRHRFGELLRQEVAHTVAHPEDIEDELHHLRAIMSG